MSAPTILFITSTQSIGFSPSGKGGKLTVLPADASGDLGLSIEALLAAMPGKPKQVYVLTTEVWSQAVTVESRSLRRIDKAQIPQMLAFEAESFSGIAAGTARTAIEALQSGPLETTFWVSQLDANRFAQAADAVAFNGGRLLGVLHPAGLPMPLHAASSDWTRLELWDDATVVVSRRGRSSPQRRFLTEPDVPIATAGAARDFLVRSEADPGGTVELLSQSMAGLDADADLLQASPEVIDLSDQANATAFLAAWSKTLRKPKNVPVLLPVRRPASAQTKRTLSLAATAAAVVGISAHYHLSAYWNENRAAELEAQISELQRPIDQFQDQRNRLSEVEDELAATRDKVAELETQIIRYRGQLGIHRTRMATLLRTLAESRPRDLVLSQVQSDGNEIRVIGRSVRPDTIIQFATEMAERLEPMNLSLRVPRREALLVTPDGGPYEFEYVISDGA
jgi:Tfp pilus assembly protein PilN